MPAFRVLSLALVAIWIGGSTTLGLVAAPSVFAMLEAHDPVGGRALAGQVFGDIFRRFQYLCWGLGAGLLALLGLRALLGPRPRRLALQVSLVAGMLAASAYSGLVLGPRITSMRDATDRPLATLPEGDPRRVEFGRLHGLSNGLMALTLAAGLGVFWIESRD